MKKIVLFILIFAIIGGTAFAFDIHSFPSPIKKGSLLISPMLGLGYQPGFWHNGYSYYSYYGYSWFNYRSYDNAFALAIPVAIEYALPINFALTVGGEVGIAFGFTSGKGTILNIPVLAKVAWHPNFEVANLDVYTSIKIGIGIGILAGFRNIDTKAGVGFGFGWDVGARYFFSPKIGIIGELGWNRYGFVLNYTEYFYRYTWSMPMHTFFRFGLTFLI